MGPRAYLCSRPLLGSRLLLAVALLVSILAGCGTATGTGTVATGAGTHATPPAWPAATSPAGNQGEQRLFVEPDDGVTPVLNAIATATSSIELKMYLLTERDAIEALKTAQRRGVRVRVILEQRPYGSGPGNEGNYQALQAAGIAVRWGNPVFRLTHEKSLIIDHKVAFIMTLNLVHSAFTRNREFGIVTARPAEVAEVLDGFEADWNRTAFTPPADSPLLWSNVNSRRKLLAFIDGARDAAVGARSNARPRGPAAPERGGTAWRARAGDRR